MRNFLPKCFGFSESKHTISHVEQPSAMIEELCHRFSLAQLRKATNDFEESRIFAEGGFGVVYKGCVLINGEAKEVAIKRFKKQRFQDFDKLFKNEIVLLCQLHHPNLVSLVGFCYDKNEMITVGDYMSNRSLSTHLHRSDTLPLSWKRRLEICIGAARGLHYLHTGTKYTILHCNLKPANILLDENWVPKISDFGLSLRGPISTSQHPKPIETAARGTTGYLAPEFFNHLPKVTEKVDVYSFGAVLFEVACAKKVLDIWRVLEETAVEDDENKHKNNDASDSECSVSMPNSGKIINYLVQKGNAEENIDPLLRGKIAPECWDLFIDIACKCLLLEPTERPHMGEVEVELERALQLQEEADAKLSSGSEHSLLCNTSITSELQQPNNEGLVATHIEEINPC